MTSGEENVMVARRILSIMRVTNATLGSSQDGGIGRNALPPRTTKRRITTNLKTINNQKCQKIKLHGTLTTNKLKKKSTRTTRLVRWTVQADSENPGKAAEGRGWLPSSGDSWEGLT